jgi:hypothetical protein
MPDAPVETMAPAPGIYAGMDDATYRVIDAVSHSDLQAFAADARGVKKPKRGRALVIGSAVDAIVFDADQGLSKFCVLPDETPLNTKEGKAVVAAFEEAHEGRVALRPSEYKLVSTLVKSLRKHGGAQKILTTPGQSQLSIIGEIEGVACKCRIDKVCDTPEALWLVDLKTTGCEDEQKFRNSVVDFGYASQGAMYCDLYHAAALEKPPQGYLLLCVSKRMDYDEEGYHRAPIWIVTLTPEQLAFGRRWYQDVLGLWRKYRDGT